MGTRTERDTNVSQNQHLDVLADCSRQTGQVAEKLYHVITTEPGLKGLSRNTVGQIAKNMLEDIDIIRKRLIRLDSYATNDDDGGLTTKDR